MDKGHRIAIAFQFRIDAIPIDSTLTRVLIVVGGVGTCPEVALRSVAIAPPRLRVSGEFQRRTETVVLRRYNNTLALDLSTFNCCNRQFFFVTKLLFGRWSSTAAAATTAQSEGCRQPFCSVFKLQVQKELYKRFDGLFFSGLIILFLLLTWARRRKTTSDAY